MSFFLATNPQVQRLVNLSLRGLTMSSRLLLLLLLASLLEPEELGLFGLIAATISYSLFFLGVDFYIHTARELVKHKKSSWGPFVKSQMVLAVLTYLLVFPIIAFVFALGILPLFLAPWIVILMVLEHVNQEFSRFFIAVGKPLTASVVFFLRSAVWVLPIALLMLLQSEAVRLTTILLCWTGGCVLASSFGLYALYRLQLGGWRERVKWPWILEGLRIALPFLMATLCLRALFTLDRYLFEAFVGLETLAAYVLFVGIATALNSFLEAGVFAFLYPSLIKAWSSKSASDFRIAGRALLLQTLVISSIFCIVAFIAMPTLISWLDHTVYSDNIQLFYWLLLAMVFFALSMVPHYSLYAQGLDKVIIYSHVGALAMFLVVVLITNNYADLLSIPLALCVTFFSLLAWKSVACILMTPSEYKWFSKGTVG